jgi:hypothetical protein
MKSMQFMIVIGVAAAGEAMIGRVAVLLPIAATALNSIGCRS